MIGEMINRRVCIKNSLIKFIIFDALFLPYVSIVHVLISVLLIVIYFLVARKMRIDKPELAVFLIIAMVLISVVRGGIDYPMYRTVMIRNGAMLCLGLIYYLFALRAFRIGVVDIDKIFYIQIFFSATLAVIYFLKPQMYFDIRTLFTMSGIKINYTNALHNRYTFLQSDPNNNPPILCAMMLYILFKNKVKNISNRIILYTAVGISVAASFSTTGLIAFTLSIFIYEVSIFGKYYQSINYKEAKRILMLICTTILIIIIAVVFSDYGLSHIFQVNFLATLVERLSLTTSGGTMSGRTTIWLDIIRSYNWEEYIFIGKGDPLVDASGVPRAAHNGHFHMILAYGAISWALFLYIAFRKIRGSRKWIILLPLFIIFTMNTVVIDYRALVGISIVCAAYHSQKPISIQEPISNKFL